MQIQHTHTSIKLWAREDRPREKSILFGHEKLSDAELLSIILGSGTKQQSALGLAQHILSACHNNIGRLKLMNMHELMKFKGIGQARAVTIKSVIELARRISESRQSQTEMVEDAETAYCILKPYLDQQPVEESYVLYLNQRNQLLSIHQLSKGGITQTIIDKRIIFKRALELGAVRFIISHNHPSGVLKPSEADKKLTREVWEAGNLMGIQLLDHIIIGNDGFFSFANQGMMEFA